MLLMYYLDYLLFSSSLTSYDKRQDKNRAKRGDIKCVCVVKRKSFWFLNNAHKSENHSRIVADSHFDKRGS